MDTTVVLIAGGILVAIAFALASQLSAGVTQQANPTTPFIRKKKLLSPDQLEFYQLLIQSIPDGSQILLKIRLGELLNLPLSSKDFEKWREHSLHMNVDFLICQSSDLTPYLVIDYQDYDSMNRKQKYHYSIKEKILQDAGLPFICYDLNREYESSELSEDIEEASEEFREISALQD